MEIRHRDQAVWCGSHALRVLDAFGKPLSLSAALARLGPRSQGAHDWVELTETVIGLWRAGILVAADAPRLLEDPAGFDAAPIHRAMLDDRTRTARYLAAIRETVRPGDVVLDIGTGTGILAMAAARKGARVYAVEAGGMAATARLAFAQNDLADRITLIEGWSTRISLPEKADVLVAEIIGNDPLAENVAEVFADACRRLLKTDARLIPRRVRLWAAGLGVPAAVVERRTFTARGARRWRRFYGFDFTALAESMAAGPARLPINPFDARRWPLLAGPILIADVKLGRALGPRLRARRVAHARRAGSLNGSLLYFGLELGPTTHLEVGPDQARAHNSWRCPLWIDPHPLRVRRGQKLVLSYQHASGSSRLRFSPAAG